eukprot:gene24194-9792_t
MSIEIVGQSSSPESSGNLGKSSSLKPPGNLGQSSSLKPLGKVGKRSSLKSPGTLRKSPSRTSIEILGKSSIPKSPGDLGQSSNLGKRSSFKSPGTLRKSPRRTSIEIVGQSSSPESSGNLGKSSSLKAPGNLGKRSSLKSPGTLEKSPSHTSFGIPRTSIPGKSPFQSPRGVNFLEIPSEKIPSEKRLCLQDSNCSSSTWVKDPDSSIRRSTSQSGPSNVHSGPSTSQYRPSTSQSGPSNVQDGPSTSQYRPSTSMSGPSNIQSRPPGATPKWGTGGGMLTSVQLPTYSQDRLLVKTKSLSCLATRCGQSRSPQPIPLPTHPPGYHRNLTKKPSLVMALGKMQLQNLQSYNHAGSAPSSAGPSWPATATAANANPRSITLLPGKTELRIPNSSPKKASTQSSSQVSSISFEALGPTRRSSHGASSASNITACRGGSPREGSSVQEAHTSDTELSFPFTTASNLVPRQITTSMSDLYAGSESQHGGSTNGAVESPFPNSQDADNPIGNVVSRAIPRLVVSFDEISSMPLPLLPLGSLAAALPDPGSLNNHSEPFNVQPDPRMSNKLKRANTFREEWNGSRRMARNSSYDSASDSRLTLDPSELNCSSPLQSPPSAPGASPPNLPLFRLACASSFDTQSSMP